MLPDTAERGYSVCGALRIGGTPEGYTDCSASTGTEPCGTVWTPPVLGWSERHTVTGAGKAEPFAVSPELTGTLPEEAQHGERED